MQAILGIDIGTTATKVSLASIDGGVLAERSAPCTVESSSPGRAEVRVEQWWDNVCSLIPEVIGATQITPNDIKAVGVAGMVPTLICLDESGRPLHSSIQQNDARAVAEMESAQQKLESANLLKRTGSPISTQSIGPKVQWLHGNNGRLLAATNRICGSYDWVVTQLTSVQCTEANWALESGLWDMTVGAWADDLLEAYGVDSSWLAPVRYSHEIVGTVSEEASRATGLPTGVPVSSGAADHVASALSAGVVDEGDLLVKLGGAGDILLATAEPVVDERVFLDHHLIPDTWMLNGCMSASGSILRWFQRELGSDASFRDLDDAASTVEPGCSGLVALPYFLGEKSPINDPKARGSFVGLHLGHTQVHLYRALLEAIAYGFAHHIEVFRENGFSPEKVRVTNGGSRSRLWRQIVADVIGHPLESIVDHPGSGLGAAMAAAVGAGVISWDDVHNFTVVQETIEPRLEAHQRYSDYYAIYRDLYPALAPVSHRLTDLEGAPH